MKTILYCILLTTIAYPNTCPKYFPMSTFPGISIIIPIYDTNITKPDLDCDGIIDTIDPDIDGDGVSNNNDAFPRNEYETHDTDKDGIGDNSDNYDNRLADNKLIVYTDMDKIKGNWTSAAGVPKRIYSRPRGTGVAKIEDNILYKLKLNNSQHNVIQWDISTKNKYSIYVELKVKTTLNGKSIITNRIMHYSPSNTTTGLTKKGYIHIGIGSFTHDKWQTIRRDLLKDLHDYDPNSKLLSVAEFWVKGESYLDNVEMLDYRIYEDGLSNQNWYIFGDTENAYCTSVYDKYKNSIVIKVKGQNTKTGYKLKPFYDTDINKVIQWSMKYNENFTISIKVITKDGIRYLSYRNQDDNKIDDNNPSYIYFGLGKSIINSGWHTITRDLNEDLKKFEKNNHITHIINFTIRGSGLIDDISLLRSTKAEDDPIFSHKHYAMAVSGLSTEVDSIIYDVYINTLSGRHMPEPTSVDAIVLNYKKMNDTVWKNRILIRGNVGIRLGDTNISKHPYDSNKIILKYNIRIVLGEATYSLPKFCIINLKDMSLKPISLKGIRVLLTGNTLFTPTGKILITGYGVDGEVKIFRSIKTFDDDISTYDMEEIASFKKKDEVFSEPTLSYVFNKLLIAIRKDTKGFNGRDNTLEDHKNTKGELYFIDDLEGGNLNTIWQRKVLDVEIHGMYMPTTQNNHFLMLASNGANRQYVMTINSSDHNLNNFKYSKKAFYINHPLGGGYPTAIYNENESMILYWEETNDLRRTNIVIKDLYEN